ncbi:hypothetical protein Pmani_015552 [Petrolisthes manimaculis]|uniref:Ion transport domain-containing protein n=1 Tax=Petrolisthes manimaculis TaxID=1843537 RepID=A0AAE1U798_9EUCA|nr:hypothetical protein Pmani_015552 [Petrolisthes manimaculis]
MIDVDQEVCHPTSCSPVATTCTINTTCNTQPDCLCENSKDYSWVVNMMLIFYLIIGNIMLLNLLIAIFTYVFEEVQEHSMEIWKYEMFRLIREYDHKPIFIPPFNIIEYLWRIGKKMWKLTCRKKRENLEEYMKESLETLRIFEKEAMQTYLAKIHQSEELSLYNSIKRMSEKIDKISKYIDQKKDLEEM